MASLIKKTPLKGLPVGRLGGNIQKKSQLIEFKKEKLRAGFACWQGGRRQTFANALSTYTKQNLYGPIQPVIVKPFRRFQQSRIATQLALVYKQRTQGRFSFQEIRVIILKHRKDYRIVNVGNRYSVLL